ncbi:unnamed protein product [Brassica napus]|uniref:(rape) hypothetical protein n=1 Tax=Brassica napus TaxID=3708 RepID=A0A816SN15_BRANA|nr:unnamed protein product [Brassica napus]
MSSRHVSGVNETRVSLKRECPAVALLWWRLGGCSSVVEARLLRFWEARNFIHGGGLMWVDMLYVNAPFVSSNRKCFYKSH